MKRMFILVIVLGIIGLASGYLLFAKVGGSYLSIGKLLGPSANIFERLGSSILGVEKIRRNILICGGAGALVGLVLGLSIKIKR